MHLRRCSVFDSKPELKMTGLPGRPGSNMAYRLKNESHRKTFHIRKPKKKNTFLVYLTLLKLRRNFRNL